MATSSYLLQPSQLNLTSPSAKMPTSYPQPQAMNLNSFGRSSTLDRKLKPLSLIHERSFSSMANKPNVTTTNTAITHPSYLINETHYNSGLQQQRNSLNLQLKSPNSNSSNCSNIPITNGCATTGRVNSFMRRPDTYENASPVSQSFTSSPMHQNQAFNTNNHVMTLTNQLNASVSRIVWDLKQKRRLSVEINLALILELSIVCGFKSSDLIGTVLPTGKPRF